MEPQCTHNEEEFNAHRTEGEDSTQQVTDRRSGIPGQFGDVAGNLIGLDWNVKFFSTETKEATNKDHRCRNGNPKSKDSHKSKEVNSGCSSGNVKEYIQNRENGNKDSRQPSGCEECVLLPSLGITKLENAGRDISSNTATKDIQENNGSQGLTLFHRVDETHHGTHHCREKSCTNLGTSSNQNTVQHGLSRGSTEDISMYQFPSCFLLGFLQCLHFIVPSNILPESANHDCCNCSSEEQNNHQ
mmetsp:Transcript_7195/g.13130  ORF Transcript_7195/g.13130 Transcript_7195/m.13130 type:complete len:244 (-) Transcript_7195:909-1640(-)